MIVYSVAFFRHEASAYESERCGDARGIFFVNFARALVRTHWAVNPDYALWIHHDNRVKEFPYWKALTRMQEAGLLRLIDRGVAPSLCGAMVWRMLPIWDEGVDFVICRDLDSMSTPRERKMLERWMKTDKAIHGMHDSISHSGLMGGMVSFRVASVKDRMPRPPTHLPVHGDDQRWLNNSVAPLFGDSIHYDAQWMLGPKEHPIDGLSSHIGGAFHVDPVQKFFDEHPELCPKLDIIRECEAVING